MPRPKRTMVARPTPGSRPTKPALIHKLPNARNDSENFDDQAEESGTISFHKFEKPADATPRTRNEDKAIYAGHSNNSMQTRKRRSDVAAAYAGDGTELLAAGHNSDKEVSLSSAASSPEVEMGRRIASRESSVLAIGNLRKRTRQLSNLGRPASRQRSSSIESNIADGIGLSTRRPRENSILAFGAGRKRQRQPSILGRREARARSSSVGLEIDINTPARATPTLQTGTGTIRRRGRHTSVLRTGQRDQSHESDEEEFDPEDESTPLHLSTTVADISTRPSPNSNPRKRKLSPLQATRSTPVRNHESSNDESPREVSLPVSRPQTATPEPFSESMAPPRSSSPIAASPLPSRTLRMARSVRTTSANRHQPARNNMNDDPPSSPPPLTHSPNGPGKAQKTRVKQKPIPSTLSTAQLQALLPRRRPRNPRDAFDLESSGDEEIDVSGLASGDDELTHLTVRTSRNSRRTPAPKRITKLKATAKAISKQATKENDVCKRTYGSRRVASDKENEQTNLEAEDEEHDPDDSLGPINDDSAENSQALEERIGKELKQAKRKFEVVDKWELEFEEVAASSSPWEGGR